MYLFSSKVLTEEVMISKLFLLLELSPIFSAIKLLVAGLKLVSVVIVLSKNILLLYLI